MSRGARTWLAAAVAVVALAAAAVALWWTDRERVAASWQQGDRRVHVRFELHPQSSSLHVEAVAAEPRVRVAATYADGDGNGTITAGERTHEAQGSAATFAPAIDLTAAPADAGHLCAIVDRADAPAQALLLARGVAAVAPQALEAAWPAPIALGAAGEASVVFARIALDARDAAVLVRALPGFTTFHLRLADAATVRAASDGGPPQALALRDGQAVWELPRRPRAVTFTIARPGVADEILTLRWTPPRFR